MGNKKIYVDLCKKEKSIPIYLRDFWLDAVCGESNWDVAFSEKGEEIFGCQPYYMMKKFGFKLMLMPPMTMFMGPWIKYTEGLKYHKRLGFEHMVMTSLIDNLPHFDAFNQSLNYSITNGLPYTWKNFTSTFYYTYVIENMVSTDKVFEDFEKELRYDIRKASEVISVENSDDLKEFYRIKQMTLTRKGIVPPFSYTLLSKVDEKLRALNRRAMFFARDKDGELHACLYLIWDDYSSHLLAMGEDPKYKSSRAGKLLHWEAIKYTKNVLNLSNYNFSGSAIKDLELAWRSYGAIQRHILNMRKINSRLYKQFYSLEPIRKYIRARVWSSDWL